MDRWLVQEATASFSEDVLDTDREPEEASVGAKNNETNEDASSKKVSMEMDKSIEEKKKLVDPYAMYIPR